ncbi:hypothetical protein J2Z18_004788 [Paenibacillus lactis]|uniref:Uncharacterized protein n=1 Tax=Paenibacillus lactis TaxID=228574 RepID=A0ABS4FHD5_9BACL|nr:hypothetical protein [Paenibacillus lactis]
MSILEALIAVEQQVGYFAFMYSCLYGLQHKL